MPINRKYIAMFEAGKFYHVYNRTNNKESLFLDDDNRKYFLKKYVEYAAIYVDTWAWCLMGNHFHFLIKVKEKNEDRAVTHEAVTLAFTNLFKSYSVAFNKRHSRNGNLFQRQYKRVEINHDHQLTQTIVYTHANPLKHGVVSDFTKYKWSSYQTIVSEKQTVVAREEVLEWFGGKDHFTKDHKDMADYFYNFDKQIED